MASYHALPSIERNRRASLSSTEDQSTVTEVQKNTATDSDCSESHGWVPTEHDSLTEQPGTQQTTTNLQALMHLLKGNIGTGIMALPSAFKYGGLWLGFAGIFVMGVIAIHCMHLLVSCAQHIRRSLGYCSVDYGEVVKQSFRLGPSYLQRFAEVARIVVNIFLCITQFGFCTVYILFVADNICQVLETFTSVEIYHYVYKVIVAVLLIPYICIRQLKWLSPFSLIANLLMIVGLVITLQYCFQQLPSTTSRPAVADISTLPLYFGIAVFAFEGIGVVLPIENKMKTPTAFVGWCGVINVGMTIAMAFYAAVGFFGYLRFGDDVLGSITLNLPCAQWLYASVKLMFAVAIFFTYGVQFYVPIEILWPPICDRINNVTFKNYGEYLLRLFFLCVTFVLAATIPHLDLMISLVGALSSSAVALIFPPLLELITFSSDRDHFGRLYWKAVKDCLIIAIGILGFFIGTIVTIQNIIKDFSKPSDSSCHCDAN